MAKNLLKEFPSNSELLEWYKINGSNIIHEINNHLHTPYSFSSFTDLRQVFYMAIKEDIKLLGINDFYTMAGYEEFNELATEYKLFPFYNIEFMGLMKGERKAGIRVNDPNNPGRVYLSGKGLDFPVVFEGNSLRKLENVKKDSAIQTEKMLKLASEHLEKIDPELGLNYDEVLEKYTRGMLRERHIAKVIRINIFEKYQAVEERKKILKLIFGGHNSRADLKDNAAVENEIRSKLLKSGRVAFVKEDPKAFLEIEDLIKIITDAGGIPTYPVLLDDPEGNFTEYEKDPEELFNKLTSMNIYSLEFIPVRNDRERLAEYVNFFHDRNFIISFGTEHNTPDLIPLKIVSRGGHPLDEELKRICFECACVQAAHQYYRAKGEDGYIDRNGKPRLNMKDEFIEIGNAVIEYYLQSL